MKLRTASAALAAALLLAPGVDAAPAQVPTPIPCAAGDRACIARLVAANPVRTAPFWKPYLARPIESRIGPAPAALVDYVNLDNLAEGFDERPRPSRLAPDFLADVRGAIADLPPAVRRVLDDTFAGVWFVDDLGGTGYTDLFRDGADKPIGGFVVLDASVLGRFRANAWATWKENTPFKAADGWTLEARIEDAPGDDRRSAIRYILMHELGHVLAIGRHLHPRWDRMPKETPADERFPFFDLSWRVDRAANRFVSEFDAVFPLRASVAYYLKPKLSGTDMVAVYDALERTSFPTLYAATSPGDDFAESFVSYVHTVLLKRPWEITIRHDGKIVKTYHTCWAGPRCAAKRAILESLLR